MYSIGDLSRRTGVKVPTIRYYEQMGLLKEADRSEGNQRRYEKADLDGEVDRLIMGDAMAVGVEIIGPE